MSLINEEKCNWCENKCHSKCNTNLGCIKCNLAMIPGYHATNCDITGMAYHTNDKTYNPYNQHNLINHIGDQIDNAFEREAWSTASNCLNNCKYTTYS